MTSEKSVATEQRLNALIAALGAAGGNSQGSVYSPDPWHAFTFNVAHGWGNYGGGYTAAQYRFSPVNSDLVECIGMITAPGSGVANGQAVTVGVGSVYVPLNSQQVIPLMPALGWGGSQDQLGDYPNLSISPVDGVLYFWSNTRIASVTYWFHGYWSMTA